MKRILSLFLTIVTLFTFCACGKADPLTWQEQYELGVRYLSEGNYEEAIIAFTAAIEIDPKQPVIYEKMAEAYCAVNDFEKAKSILQQGIDATDDPTLKAKLEELSISNDSQHIEDAVTDIDNPATQYGNCWESAFYAADRMEAYDVESGALNTEWHAISWNEYGFPIEIQGMSGPSDTHGTIEWDNQGRAVKVTMDLSQYDDITQIYVYDISGKLLPSNSDEVLKYDELGRVIQYDRLDTSEIIHYDDYGRIERIDTYIQGSPFLYSLYYYDD